MSKIASLIEYAGSTLSNAHFVIKNGLATSETLNLTLVVEEFFHKDLRGFGGFGKTVQNLSHHYNEKQLPISVRVALTSALSVAKYAGVKEFHDTEVLFRPAFSDPQRDIQYRQLLRALRSDLFVTIDYYPSYNGTLLSDGEAPIMIYIRDPRSREEWRKLGSVPFELKQRSKETVEDLLQHADEKAAGMARLLEQAQRTGRKVFFATGAKCLVERACRTYGVDDIDAYLLYNPIPLPPGRREPEYTSKPSLCYLGRLDAVKRFWIVLELARRFEEVDFYLCGESSDPHLFEPVLAEYENLENVHFEGLVTGIKKQQILSKCWGLINTSVHEGYPVSFQEAFSYGKPVISCQNPDGVVERFGYYTGEIIGNGLDEASLRAFEEQLERFLSDPQEAREKGRQGRAFVEEKHSFEAFHATFSHILREELGEELGREV